MIAIINSLLKVHLILPLFRVLVLFGKCSLLMVFEALFEDFCICKVGSNYCFKKFNINIKLFKAVPSCNGNHVFMVDHGYPWLFHDHVFIFHTHGQECNHSAMKTWLTIVIIMVITSFPVVNHSSLKKEYNGRPL